MAPSLSPDDRRALLGLAEDALRHALAGGTGAATAAPAPPSPDTVSQTLREPGASFVTLEHTGRLIGCIGTLEPVRPLADDVAHNTLAAAFADPRLPPLQADELPGLSIKVSVLAPLEPVDATTEQALLAALEPEVDGVLIDAGGRRGTFLPSVWPQVADGHEFLGLLFRKAGLPLGVWPAGLQAWRYRTEEFVSRLT